MLAGWAVALLALFAAMDYYRSVTDYNEANPDPFRIGIQPARFREVSAEFRDGAVIGYLSDVAYEDVRGGAAFFGTLYALAPRVVVVPHTNPRKQDWVLGNFSAKVDIEQIARENRLRVVRDYGEGVVLYQREGQ